MSLHRFKQPALGSVRTRDRGLHPLPQRQDKYCPVGVVQDRAVPVLGCITSLIG